MEYHWDISIFIGTIGPLMVYAFLGAACLILSKRIWIFFRTPPPTQIELRTNVKLTHSELWKIIFCALTFHLAVYAIVALILAKQGKLHGEFISYINSWCRWDGINYVKIATHGYQNTSDLELEKLIVFLPLYPALIATIHFLMSLPYEMAGLLINTALTPVLAVGFYKLVRLDMPHKMARYAVMLLLAAPIAAFHFMVYTEVLFLTCTVWAFFFARSQKWHLSGLLVLAASLTRTSGYFIAPALAFELIIQWRKSGGNIPQKRTLTLLAAPIALLLYLAINYIVYKDPFKFLYWQKTNWYKSYSSLFDGIKNAFQLGKIEDISGFHELITGRASEAIAVFVSSLAIVWGALRLRLSYVLFMLGCFWFFMSTSFILSTARYASVLFPFYILLASFFSGRSKLLWTWITASVFLLVYLCWAATQGPWVG